MMAGRTASTFRTGHRVFLASSVGGFSAIADNDSPAKIDANEAMTMRRVELLI